MSVFGSSFLCELFYHFTNFLQSFDQQLGPPLNLCLFIMAHRLKMHSNARIFFKLYFLMYLGMRLFVEQKKRYIPLIRMNEKDHRLPQDMGVFFIWCTFPWNQRYLSLKMGATWKLFGDFRNLEEPIIWSIFRCEVMCVPFRLVGSYFLLRVKRPWFLTKKIIWSNWSNIFLSLKVHHQQLYTKKRKNSIC